MLFLVGCGGGGPSLEQPVGTEVVLQQDAGANVDMLVTRDNQVPGAGQTCDFDSQPGWCSKYVGELDFDVQPSHTLYRVYVENRDDVPRTIYLKVYRDDGSDDSGDSGDSGDYTDGGDGGSDTGDVTGTDTGDTTSGDTGSTTSTDTGSTTSSDTGSTTGGDDGCCPWDDCTKAKKKAHKTRSDNPDASATLTLQPHQTVWALELGIHTVNVKAN